MKTLTRKTVIKPIGKKTVFAIGNIEEKELFIKKLEMSSLNDVVVDLFILNFEELKETGSNPLESMSTKIGNNFDVKVFNNVAINCEALPYKSFMVKYNQSLLNRIDSVNLEEFQALAIRVNNFTSHNQVMFNIDYDLIEE